MPISVGELEATIRLKDELTAKLQAMVSSLKGVGTEAARVGEAGSKGLDHINDTIRISLPLFRGISDQIRIHTDLVKTLAEAYGVFKLAEFAVQIGDEAKALRNLSAETGIGVQNLQALGLATKDFGVSTDELARSIYQLSRRVAGNDQSAASALNAMGVSLKGLKSLAPDQLFLTVLDSINKVPDPLLRSAFAAQLFGSRMAEGLLAIGPNLRELVDEAAQSGSVMSEDAVRGAAAFSDALDHLLTRLKAVAGIHLAPAMKELASSLDLLLNPTGTGPKDFGPQEAFLAKTVQTLEDLAKLKPTAIPVSVFNQLGVGASVELQANLTAQINILHGLRDALTAVTPVQAAFLEKLRQQGQLKPENLLGTGISVQQLEAFKEATAHITAAEKARAEAQRQLAAAMIPLTEAQANIIAGAKASGQSIELVAKAFGISTEAARVYADNLKVVDEVNRKFTEEANKHFKQFAAEREAQLKGTNETLIQVFNQEISLREQHNQAIDKLTLTEFQFQVTEVERWQNEMNAALLAVPEDLRGGAWERAWEQVGNVVRDKLQVAVNAESLASMKRAVEIAGQQTGQGFVQSFSATIEALPGILENAFTGGGGLSGAISAIGIKIGSDLGKSIAQSKIGQGVGDFFGNIFGVKTAEGAGAVANSLTGLLQAGIGAAIGLAVKGISALWHALFPSEADKIRADTQRDFGVAISDGLNKAIEDTEGRLHIGRFQATLLNLDKIIAEAGGVGAFGFDKAVKSAHDLFSVLQRGEAPVAEIGTEFDKVFGQLVPEALDKMTGVAKANFVELERLARQAGLTSKAMDDFVRGQIQSNVIPGLQAFSGAVNDARTKLADIEKQMEGLDQSSDTWKALNKQATDQKNIMAALAVTSDAAAQALSAGVLVAFAELQKQGVPLKDIVAQLGPLADQLAKQFQEAGVSGGAAFADLLAQLDLAQSAVAGPVLQAIAGLAQTLVGLGNIGLLDQATFSGLTSQIAASFDALVAQGVDGTRALRLLQQPLQQIWQLQQQFGFSVDAATQALLDQAVAAGLVGEKNKPVQDQMLDALNAIQTATEDLAAVFSQAFGVELPSVAKKAADDLKKQLGDIQVPTIHVPVTIDLPLPGDIPGVPGPEVPSFDAGTGGLFPDFGRGTLAVLHGRERVTPLAEAQAEAQQSGAGPTVDLRGSVILDGPSFERFLNSKVWPRMPNAVLRDIGGVRRSIKRAAK